MHYQVFMLVSVSFIVTSTVTMTLNTLPYFQQHHHEENASSNSSTTLSPTSTPATSAMSTTSSYDADTTDSPVLAAIETVCVAWFTFEFLIRCVKSALPQSTVV